MSECRLRVQMMLLYPAARLGCSTCMAQHAQLWAALACSPVTYGPLGAVDMSCCSL